MPYSIKTKDGIVVDGIPDDIPKGDQSLRDLVAQLRASGQKSASYGGSPAPEASAVPQESSPPGFLEQLVPTPSDLGAAARGIVGGIAAPVTMVADPLNALINHLLPDQYKQLPPSEGLQLLLTQAGVPEAQTEAQKILQAASAGMAGGAGQVAAGAALKAAPGVAGAVGEALAAQPVQQLIGGASAGASAEAARQAGAPEAVQLAAGIAGGAAGAGLSGVKAVPSPVGPVQEAQQAGVRLMTSDVRPPQTFASRWLRATAEKIPVAGTGPVRAAQQAERVNAVRDLVRQYGAEDLGAVSNEVMADVLAKRSADLGKWSQAKNEVIDKLSGANDFSGIIEGDNPLPDGWFVHGRNTTKGYANDSWPTQFTKNIDIANGYAGRNGEVWAARPKSNAKVLDFSSEYTDDMDSFVNNLKKIFNSEYPDINTVKKMIADSLDKNVNDLSWNEFESAIRSEFTPIKIADHAGAFDSPELINLLGHYSGRSDSWPDFVKTPDGAVMIPGSSNKIESVNLSNKLSNSVPMPATTQKIDDSIAYLQQLKTDQVKPVIAVLQDWRQAVQNQDLRNVEALRKQIGEAFTAPDLASVRSTGEKILSAIYPAVKDDMTAYIKANGGPADLTKWQVANKELSKMASDLDNTALKRVLDKGSATPEEVRSLLFSKKPSDVQTLYNSLTPSGQASARSAVIAKAAEEARVQAEQGGEYMSPDRFATSIKKMGSQVGVFFSGDSAKELEGLMRVLDYTKRASQASVAPPTGVQLAIPAGAAALSQVFGTGVKGFAKAMTASAAIGGASRVYESKAVRDILTKLPTLKSGGPEEAALFKRLAATVSSMQGSPASPGEKAKPGSREWFLGRGTAPNGMPNESN